MLLGERAWLSFGMAAVAAAMAHRSSSGAIAAASTAAARPFGKLSVPFFAARVGAVEVIVPCAGCTSAGALSASEFQYRVWTRAVVDKPRCWAAMRQPLAFASRSFMSSATASSSSSFSPNSSSSSSPSVRGSKRRSDKMEEIKDLKRRNEEFKRMLQEPDDIYIRGGEARKMFSLSRSDLKELGDNYIVKESPFDSKATPSKQYPLTDVVELAKKKHSTEALLNHFSQRYLPRYGPGGEATKIYGHYPEKEEEDETPETKSVQLSKMYWYNAPSTTTVEGRQSVLQGLKTNLGICLAKGAVWLGTGSHVMFADLMHSMADVLNYSYRLVELNRSSRIRDVYHPYGYAPLRYITADRSFVFLGFVGGVCPLVAGVSEMMHHRDGLIPMGDLLIAPAAVFVISALLEGVAVKTAYREILSLYTKELGDETESHRYGLREVIHYLREGNDVMSTATFTEASSGVLASMTGFCGVGASWYLQSGAPDVGASMLMAGLVCGVSSFLLRKSGTALLGQTLPRWRVQELVAQLEEHPAVVNVYDVKTEMIGMDTVRFKAEVQFNPQVITERILQTEVSTTRIEGKVPEAASSASHAVITARMRQALPLLQKGLPVEADAAAWLYRNNNLFYEALAWELKDVEKVVRQELKEFRNVHIDLEPW